MSTAHEVRVVRLWQIDPLPTSDLLGLVHVDGRPVVIRKSEWNFGDLAVYVPIDAMVPIADPRFAFLGGRADNPPDANGRVRIRPLQLRGQFSMGLLVRPDVCKVCGGTGWVQAAVCPGEDGECCVECPAPTCDRGSAWHENQDVTAELGIEQFDPPQPDDPDAEPDPGFLPGYDIEDVRKWGPAALTAGEAVVLDEKVNGATGRFAWHSAHGEEPRLWVASSSRFKRLDTDNPWTAVARRLGLAERLATQPGLGVYGEVYGHVPGMDYSQSRAEPGLVVFDMVHIPTRRWLDRDEVRQRAADLDLPMVPEVYRGPWSPDLFSYAEGWSPLNKNGGHVREGFVLRPLRERYYPGLGRVVLKLHGQDYLLGRKRPKNGSS